MMVSEDLKNQWVKAAMDIVITSLHEPMFVRQIDLAFLDSDLSDDNFWEAETALQIIDVLKQKLEDCSLAAAKIAIEALSKSYKTAIPNKAFV